MGMYKVQIRNNGAALPRGNTEPAYAIATYAASVRRAVSMAKEMPRAQRAELNDLYIVHRTLYIKKGSAVHRAALKRMCLLV